MVIHIILYYFTPIFSITTPSRKFGMLTKTELNLYLTVKKFFGSCVLLQLLIFRD